LKLVLTFCLDDYDAFELSHFDVASEISDVRLAEDVHLHVLVDSLVVAHLDHVQHEAGIHITDDHFAADDVRDDGVMLLVGLHGDGVSLGHSNDDFAVDLGVTVPVLLGVHSLALLRPEVVLLLFGLLGDGAQEFGGTSVQCHVVAVDDTEARVVVMLEFVLHQILDGVLQVLSCVVMQVVLVGRLLDELADDVSDSSVDADAHAVFDGS